jgi:hypothetical protein
MPSGAKDLKMAVIMLFLMGNNAKKGTPVNYVPEAKAKVKALSKSSNKAKKTETKPNKKNSGSGGSGSAARKNKETNSREKVSDIVSAAKSRGLSNDEVRKIKNEVKTELSIKRVQGKEAVKLFAKKADDLVKSKDLLNRLQSSPKREIKTFDPEEVEILEQMKKQGLVVQIWGLRPDSPALYALKNELNKYSEDIE